MARFVSRELFDSFKAHMADLREADQEAVKVLASNFESRMANTNEWRGAVDDQQKNLANKQDTERRLKALEDAQLANASKSIGVGQLWATAAAVVVAVAAIMAIIFNFK
jgi:hypothetical protein